MDNRQAVADLLRGRRVGRGREGIADDGECWIFLGFKNGDGYGQIHRRNYRGGAHRYVYLQLRGEISADLHVLHTCDNRACVRPSHLWLGTHADNIRDMFAKGRGIYPPRVRPTHCAQGHLLDEGNRYVAPSGGGRCRRCMHVKNREWAERNRERKREYMRTYRAARTLAKSKGDKT